MRIKLNKPETLNKQPRINNSRFSRRCSKCSPTLLRIQSIPKDLFTTFLRRFVEEGHPWTKNSRFSGSLNKSLKVKKYITFKYEFLHLFKYFNKYPYINILIPVFLFLFTLIIYIHHLSPGVYGGDSGDLLSAIIKRGVPHPSGYPLYTILGIIFLKLPLTTTVAWKVGCISAVSSSISVVIMYLIIFELTRNRYLGIITSLILAFLYPFWLFAEVTEVFALNSLFVLLMSLLTIKYLHYKKIRYLYYLAFFTGLSLTNNLTIILFFPAMCIGILSTNIKILFKVKVLIICLILFLFGLLPYIYIPIVAISNQTYNWGKAVNFENFIALFFRKDYGWGTSLKGLSNQSLTKGIFYNYYLYISTYINLVIPFFSFLGAVYLLIKRRYKEFSLFFILYLFFGPLFLVYIRTHIKSFLAMATFEKFYLAGIIILIYLVPFGILLIQEVVNKLLKRKSLTKAIEKIVLSVFIIIAILNFITNYPKTNFKDVYIGDNYAKDLLSSLSKDSMVIFISDSAVFNSLYLQNSYGFRQDIYIPGMHDGFRKLLEQIGLNNTQIEEYIIKNRGSIKSNDIFSSIGSILSEREIFLDHQYQLKDSRYGDIVPIPYGLVYKFQFEKDSTLTKDEYLSKVELVTKNYHLDDLEKETDLLSNNLVFADIKKNYSIAFFNIAKHLAEYYENKESAVFYLKKSIELDPTL
ncbi:hypothetical protein A2Z22_00265 [Candidatus Woesebacteria bacterium RBG_16_34_12]|uniref:Glycosyltransferase RgtA/B/C/D-like domain-containing protein n=1 Tax=Candidatus Woesebacteria bacterium RBG_16_34_12 TaxID=1802480 RepID=A0A1F7X8U3_9BACT|nr:MAG: hypothetical protein A2Z22_00265 [Candidatus Woesebacteria bacterium RBG_16_34_12]